MMSAVEYREQAARTSDLADSASDADLKGQLKTVSVNWAALAVIAEWQDVIGAKLDCGPEGLNPALPPPPDKAPSGIPTPGDCQPRASR